MGSILRRQCSGPILPLPVSSVNGKQVQPYTRAVKQLMAEKSAILTKARVLTDMGMDKIATVLWASAADFEERLAPLLEAQGRETEAAVHRISAASCYRHAGNPSRAANLFRAALAGPLPTKQMCEVQRMLAECLFSLTRSSVKSAV